ncbi:hypothetical protein [Alloalcanivorax xenomutans]|uniref:Uncharacterized protein n=1 Tax=Alloalcanivorax xenomutans TaxID=1094342 RepID=A0A9Q3W8K3_9GAMM|nr:hypothetical protein [Alloalcanivorax xenomutans]MCE7510514.1 hypothetical protein [Alloalcanivorax xenomutans]
MTVQEREWLRGFTPLDKVGGTALASTLRALWASAPGDNGQDFVCLPPLDQDNFLGQVGHSPDRKALIVCSRQLHIIPAQCIVALRLQKLRPAKGGGGAALTAVFQATDGMEREVSISGSHGDMDALDDLASHLSRILNRPLRIPEPQYDC